MTSPPYWNVVDYGIDGQIGQTSYEGYLEELMCVWRETLRVLIPNGKLAIVTPIMPIPKQQIGDQHTRHLKNIAFDIEASILRELPALHRYGLFVWKKQTTTKMFGSYPYPPNIYEDNTIEFVNVYVKDGPPPPISKEAKEPSKLTQAEWRNLSMQIWPMYPEDVKRTGGHPAPFRLCSRRDWRACIRSQRRQRRGSAEILCSTCSTVRVRLRLPRSRSAGAGWASI